MELDDEFFMQRAIYLAGLGKGKVSPNPMVGCVIVHDNDIIGEGWHKEYGGPHAEVNAINSVQDPSLLSKATAFVTLEPCAHHGKTPPCADLLIEKNLSKVVIGHIDPFPEVAGKGIQKLEQAGISVTNQVLSEECYTINRRFFTHVNKKRPYIILKWAQTQDGFIARENYDSKWISNDHSRRLVHKWRAEEDAIMVGTNTALYDNPQLNIRDWKGKDPIRVIIDKKLRLQTNLHVFDKSQPTLIYNTLNTQKEDNLEYVQLHPMSFISDLLSDLNQRNIQSIIIEGGGQLLTSLIQNDWWDEARVFTSPGKFGKGISAPKLMGIVEHQENIREDLLTTYRNTKA